MDAEVIAKDGDFKLSVGTEYTTGEYGGTESVDEWYVPVTGKYTTDRWALRLTVPYIRVSAASGTTLTAGPDGEIIASSGGERVAESGLGDIITSLTYYDIVNAGTSGLVVDLIGKIKFGSADEDKGLGTGETDFKAQLNLFKVYGNFIPFGSIGYTLRGDPPNTNFNNVLSGSMGVEYRYTSWVNTGVDFYFREASLPGSAEQREMTAYADWKLEDKRKLRGYLLRGLSNGSPDWGVGLMATFAY